MLRNDTRSSYALTRYVTIILASLLFLVFAYTRSSAAESASSSKQTSPASPQTYITTVNNLNVREAPNAESRILKVVTKGTLLSVEATVSGGWLKLAGGGGYVKGKYASPVKSNPAAGEVKTLSYTASSGSEATEAVLPLSEIESVSGLTKDQIGQLFEDTELLGHDLEEVVLEVEDKYGINAYFTIAVMKLESGNGSSKLSDNKNNLFGLSNGKGGYIKFKTKADSVRKFGELISENYIDEGYTTIEKIAGKYCPPNKDWATHVKNIIKRDHKLLEGVSV